MIISPPFLIASESPITEETWLDQNMMVPEGEGAYPATDGFAWHGGMHLLSPLNVPVRAIADGIVVYRRDPTERNNDETHPLNYDAGSVISGWTSDGCIIIRHDTEIGEGDTAEVSFFSIYMHLEEIADAAKKGKAIYRKDVISQAGYIYGKANQIHFEIICDDANLQKLIGRIAGDMNIAADGRRDAVYGEMYFRLPAGTQIFENKPPVKLPANTAAPEPIHTTTIDLYVGIRYARHAYVTTYQVDGMIVGAPLEETDFEYELYKKATGLQTQCPSAAYELLRFGRVLGPDTLAPVDTPHWRQVCYPGGQGWVNLAPSTIQKFSDADFPQWRDWTLVDDSADLNSRMDAPTIRDWLDTDHDGQVTPEEARSRLRAPEVQEKLRKTICKLPTEWNAETIDARWDWLKTVTPEHPEALNEEDFQRLKAHIAKLCFWKEANLGIDANHWHFHPTEFIQHFRKCGWLTQKDIQKIYPAATQKNISKYRNDLNKTIRKYLITHPLRIGHFYGQAAVESNQFLWMSELFNGDPHEYFRHYAKAKNYAGWLGNIKWNDGGDFRGRGLKQLTGRSNYCEYWLYRGWIAPNSFKDKWWHNLEWWGISGNYIPHQHQNLLPIQDTVKIATLTSNMKPPEINNPDQVRDDSFTCVDTAGWFWAKNVLIKFADQNDTAKMTRTIRGDSEATGATTSWPPAAHYDQRVAHTNRIIFVVGDKTR